MYNGIINVYKEKGYTSHDVVAKLRGILGQRKIGHTGTLDPEAEGVLPVCLGRGTKLCDILTDKDKVYETCMLLGITTDTQDTTGSVLHEKEIVLTESEVKESVLSFVGDYSQVPPMYSAIKVNGKKLYELAREGKEIERKPRCVKIKHIRILNIDLPRVKMEIGCSKGTYIRTLCHDIGDKLQCGAAMEQLKRTRVGAFDIENSLTLAEIETKKNQSSLEEAIISVEEMFFSYPCVQVKKEFQRLLHNGNSFFVSQIEEECQSVVNMQVDGQNSFKVYDGEKNFIGIFGYAKEEGKFKPIKMFFGG